LKIFLLGMYENPTSDRLIGMKSAPFTHFSAVGTWANEKEPCQTCNWHWQRIVSPLVVQWEPSTDLIGDFSWDGPFGHTFVVKESVAERLKTTQFECSFYPVEYVKPERDRSTVQFPYEGEKLLWCECSAKLDVDMTASGIRLESSCPACGDVRYTFKRKGIVIRRSNWNDHKMFRIATNGRSDATFVTDEGRRFIENASFSNIQFSEAGEIVET